MAIDLADSARKKGNHPFGSVLVVDGKVVASAENTVCTDNDCTGHAEINLVRQISGSLDAATRARSVLYASTEPCAMCTGSIFWAGIRTVVFGCSAQKLAEYATGSFVIPCREIFARGRPDTQVIGPLFEDLAANSHAAFWR